MSPEIEVIEGRLSSFLSQLLAECGILERLIYKCKNQHRRSSYFQYLQKVRRDLKLLQSSHLGDLLESCFHLLTGRRGKQKAHLLESIKRTNSDTGKYSFMERLLGSARLLSQMVEPILKAAIEMSKLLARSFFMGFSLATLALLGKIRLLIQQMLLDIVFVFNEVYCIAQKQQSIKINQDGIEVFREYYPKIEEVITLECIWETDKYVLVEKTHKITAKLLEGPLQEPEAIKKPVTLYRSVKALLGDSEDVLDFNDPDINPDHKNQDDGLLVQEETLEITQEPPSKKPRVAFISVKKPVTAAPAAIINTAIINTAELRMEDTESVKKDGDDDPFFSLLAGGTTNGSLF